MIVSPEIRKYNILIAKLLKAAPNSNEERQLAFLLAAHCSKMARRINKLEMAIDTIKHSQAVKRPITRQRKGFFLSLCQSMSKYRG
ncbi:hypothetical protein UFOVP1454_32 [uncultured Caudovirales phage]|uniref:Uncharacterized protein n=1 Tax=uncultured Caudovirales phage TaxID=2100421 RepID=A0A6J5SJ17_9CAUD|nr:hypothetical protein UFOVP1454_32 [uncultured Caudovirales phage]